MEEVRSFKKVERSYHSASNGWRLATFEEAEKGLEEIKQQGLLNKWDIARLLDGWISGPGYDYQRGNDFRSCMGYMLLIQTQTGTHNSSGVPYADVNLSESGKEVALFLCVDDLNYEVVYWLLNCWSKSEIMNLGDVREGRLPLSDVSKFEELNRKLGYVARKLGDEAGAALEKAGKIKYCGKDSVQDVLSGMIKIVTEEKDIVQFIGDHIWHYRWYGADEYCLPGSVQTGDVADGFWSFVCDSFAGRLVELCANSSLRDIRKMKTKSASENNWMIATSILLHLSDFRSDIIHEPLAHRCLNSCAEKILSYAAEEALGDPLSFSDMLKCNAMWRCYDERRKYDVLHKLLIVVAKSSYTNTEQGEKIAGSVIDMLLKCGAQPERSYAIGKHRNKTALNYAARFQDEDVGLKVAESLLRKCNVKTKRVFVEAADEIGRTALHRASEKGNARICQLLVSCGASLRAQDTKGMTALHYAVQGAGIGEVIDVFMKSPHITKLVDLKDKRQYSPLDIVVANKDLSSAAKLLSKSKEPEVYFDQVDREQLLRHSLLLGSVKIVYKLFEKGISLPDGDCDEGGKTVLHLAAMCDNESSATKMIFFKIGRESQGNVQDMVAKRDRGGRTVLHDAALNGHAQLCGVLLDVNRKLIYIKDKAGRNPLYDAVKGKYEGTALYKQLLAAYLETDMAEDDLIDRGGLTPLHVAASEGKTQLVEELLKSDKIKKKYLSRGDILAQTALHKAAICGVIDIVEILLKHGAHPLTERDCDGRTALHYAVQAKTGDKKKMADMLLRQCASDQEKSLLLWAPAAGMGTADNNLETDDELRKFLQDEKCAIQKRIANEENTAIRTENLLQMAASIGDIEMTKALISRGYQFGDIQDDGWTKKLDPANKENVDRVSRQIEMIKEQGNDKPAISDSLGRLDYAQGLAALFLNPYIKPPIVVGITGSWGMGKSSLMVQTERILLTTVAQMALVESSELSSSTSEFPGIKPHVLSKKGEKKCEHIYRHIKNGQKVNSNIFVILRNNICSWVKRSDMEKIRKWLAKFLNKYDLKYRKVFKSVAAMDSSDMFEINALRPSAEENVPAVLTVQYNAWKYRNDTEALAGMAVEITKELEGIMTQAQWLNTCWRNTWKKKKYTLWIEIFFPSLLALVLVGSFTWIAWVVFDNAKLKEWGKAKYAWPPAAIVIMVWTLTKSVMGILKPVSTQLMQYISFPDHTDKLGYQERVISDITFLKDEIGKKACWVFIVFGWVFTTFTVLWRLVTESWVTSLFFQNRSLEKSIDAPKVTPASGSNLRIIVFVDDLDRCQESVILQVLSAINLVLAVCEINVVMGMDKRLIERAIMKKYGDVKGNRSMKASQELADMYLQKIIQLPLDLPDPSDEESRRFLKGQLGVLENENKAFIKDDRSSSGGDGEREAVQENTADQVEINVQCPLELTDTDQNISVTGSTKPPEPIGPTKIRTETPSQTDGDAPITSAHQNRSSSILIREMLFVRYSKGEEDAFLYFQGLATDCRKLPREWKRVLNYHRLVWNIFSVSKEAKNLAGWQVQLITWIFICWEWQENMNLVIAKWKEIGDLKTNAPSLLMIVEHLVEERERENTKATSYEEDGPKRTQKLGENGKGKMAKTTKPEDITKSSHDFENSENANSEKLANAMEKKLDALEKSLAELKKEIKELKEVVSDELKKDINEFKEQVSEELKNHIKEIKEQMVRKESGKSEEKWKTEKKNWGRMKSTLERYDVSMDGIQAFQRFRFYCMAGYLPRPRW